MHLGVYAVFIVQLKLSAENDHIELSKYERGKNGAKKNVNDF